MSTDWDQLCAEVSTYLSRINYTEARHRLAYLERLGFGHHRPAVYGSNPFCQNCLRGGVVYESHNVTTGSVITVYPAACPYSEV